MAAVAHVDRVTTLSAVEQYGTIIEMRREVIVTDLSDTGYDILLTALSTTGVPEAGDTLDDIGLKSLVLVKRSPRILDAGSVAITCLYRHHKNPGQNIYNAADPGTPHGGLSVASSRASLQQITTNKYPDDYGSDDDSADVALRGKPITVKYTYPDGTDAYKYTKDDGTEATLPRDPNQPGKEVIQGGEISIFEPQETLVMEGLYTTNDIRGLQKKLINHVNKDEWLGNPPRTWLVTAFEWESYDVEQTADTSNLMTFKIRIEFQYQRGTWDPTVVFKDPVDGKPPAGLKEDVGYKTIEYYPSVSFNSEYFKDLIIRS